MKIKFLTAILLALVTALLLVGCNTLPLDTTEETEKSTTTGPIGDVTDTTGEGERGSDTTQNGDGISDTVGGGVKDSDDVSDTTDSDKDDEISDTTGDTGDGTVSDTTKDTDKDDVSDTTKDTDKDDVSDTTKDTKPSEDADVHIHAWSDWSTVTEATCAIEGKRTRSCACGETEAEVVPTLAHELTSHAGLTPTFTEGGYEPYETCNNCEYTTYQEIAAVSVVEEGGTKNPVYGGGYTLSWNYDDKYGEYGICGRKRIEYDANGNISNYYYWEYNFQLDGQDIETYRVGYNASGSMTYYRRFAFYDDGSYKKTENYRYESNILDSEEFRTDGTCQKKTRIRYNPDGSVSFHGVHIYDENEVWLETTTYDGNNNVVERIVPLYNAEGKRIKETTYDADGTVTKYTEWDSDGSIIAELFTSSDGVSVTERKYYKYRGILNYDLKQQTRWENGKVVSTVDVAEDGSRKGESYKYNDDGVMEEKTVFEKNAEGITISTTYQYGEDNAILQYVVSESVVSKFGSWNNLVKRSTYGGDGTLLEWYEITYNEQEKSDTVIHYYGNGTVKSYRKKNAEGTATIKSVQYDSEGNVTFYSEYDGNGNLIKYSIRTSRGILATFEITYDDNNVKTKEFRYEDDRLTHAHEYDALGNTLVTYVYDEEGNLDRENRYEYGEDGQKSTVYVYNNEGTLIEKGVYNYDENGELVSVSYHHQ